MSTQVFEVWFSADENAFLCPENRAYVDTSWSLSTRLPHSRFYALRIGPMSTLIGVQAQIQAAGFLCPENRADVNTGCQQGEDAQVLPVSMP